MKPCGWARNDPALLEHLAGDPERILEIAADYMRFGLHEEALDVLSRQYPLAQKSLASLVLSIPVRMFPPRIRSAAGFSGVMP